MPSVLTAFRPHARAGLLPIAAALMLAACGDPTPSSGGDTAGAAASADHDADEGFIARTTREAVERARDRIANGNISVGGGGGSGTGGVHWRRSDAHDDRPRAEIGPQGDFIVDGQAVPVDDRQRALLLAHRANLVAIAETGMEIGIQGARLGLGAARDALGAVLGGQTEDFERRVEAEGERLGAEAMRICDRMPALLASQQALAEALPAFAPYARMTAADIEDCRRDTGGRADHAGLADAAP